MTANLSSYIQSTGIDSRRPGYEFDSATNSVNLVEMLLLLSLATQLVESLFPDQGLKHSHGSGSPES